jgi:citrate lyase subunit beta/citryl-CoA lyase
VLLSRVANLAGPVDGVTVEIADAGVLRDAAATARRLGFGGKLCIHPSQAAAVNDAFSPSADEIAWARRIVAAASAAGGAAVAVDGRMVDKPVILRAQAILASAAP